MHPPNQDVWLAQYVFVMTTAAAGYPRAIPDAITRKMHYTFFTSLSRMMPKSKASEAYAHALTLYPIQPYLDSRRNLIRWLHSVTDLMYGSLYNAPTTPLGEFVRAYRESCHPERARGSERRLVRRCIFGAATVAIAALILSAR